jgi:phage gpG-like protein
MAYKSKITINFKKESKVLDAITDRVRNPKPILEKIGRKMVVAVNKSFNEHKDPDGFKWQKLAEGTPRRRKEKTSRKSKNMLFDTGKLRDSLKKHEIIKKKKVHMQYEVILESDVKYAMYQNNSLMPKANFPLNKPRKFMKQTKKAQDEYRKMVRNYVIGKK